MSTLACPPPASNTGQPGPPTTVSHSENGQTKRVESSASWQSLPPMSFAQLVEYLTGPRIISYSQVSDFLLVYKRYAQPQELLDLIGQRLNHSLDLSLSDQSQRDGIVVLIRSFAILRHWLLNHFATDFLPDVDLRIKFYDFLASSTERAKDLSNNQQEAMAMRIMSQLRRCWIDQVSKYFVLEQDAVKAFLIMQPCVPLFGGFLGESTNITNANISANASTCTSTNASASTKTVSKLMPLYLQPLEKRKLIASSTSMELFGCLEVNMDVKVPSQILEQQEPKPLHKKRSMFWRTKDASKTPRFSKSTPNLKQQAPPSPQADMPAALPLENKYDILALKVLDELCVMLELYKSNQTQSSTEYSDLTIGTSRVLQDDQFKLHDESQAASLSVMPVQVQVDNSNNFPRTTESYLFGLSGPIESEFGDDINSSKLTVLTNHNQPIPTRIPPTFADNDTLQIDTMCSIYNDGSLDTTTDFFRENSKLDKELTPSLTESDQSGSGVNLRSSMLRHQDLGSEGGLLGSLQIESVGNQYGPDSDYDDFDFLSDETPEPEGVRPESFQSLVSAVDDQSSIHLFVPRVRAHKASASQDEVPELPATNGASNASAVQFPESMSEAAIPSMAPPAVWDSGSFDDSHISLLSEILDGEKMNPCAGYTDEIGAELAAIPDENPDNSSDALAHALGKLLGEVPPAIECSFDFTYNFGTRTSLVSAAVAGEERLSQQTLAPSGSHLHVNLADIQDLSISEGIVADRNSHESNAILPDMPSFSLQPIPPPQSHVQPHVLPSIEAEAEQQPNNQPLTQPNVHFSGLEIHAPFILSYPVATLFDHMTHIEVLLLKQLNWREFFDISWHGLPANSTASSWLGFIMSVDSFGVRAILARSRLVTGWVKAEILLCAKASLKAATISKFIELAKLCKENQNLATAVQITKALTSEACSELRTVWSLVPKQRRQELEDLKLLINPARNNYNLRRAHKKLDSSRGAVPDCNLFLSDLMRNESSVTHINNDLINFTKLQRSVSITTALQRCCMLLSSYELAIDPKIVSKCLYIHALTADELELLK